ncbi:DUF1444 domain-containing protein [Aquibacillus sp. 3ASR75-11]|uniref:UPF0354 protein NC797_16360 n=1 Tax=Terrihalobacillus insolitus TaxID=2950438 RepID=A0A9X3WZ75_9BACI|nr:DUF1444 domain-containing protein [Terrihalobacillus insolitus]MDC3415077.1 DUF1444 domain-containing protein [Terrihalobacillus insolitus]MDC3426074.1 DUF1444 domain-containing protein [Terrihalobacillus insolitus]
MKMTSIKMKKMLEERLQHPDWNISYNRDKDTFRVEWKESGKGITITLPNVVSKYENRGERSLDDLVNHVQEALRIMNETHELTGKEQHIFPVIRATSFPTETKSGKQLVYSDHTAETRIYYAIDLGKSYQLIDQDMLEKEGWKKSRLKEISSFNVRSLPVDLKKDRVADNDFYFMASQDGYDASRILNESLLEEMKANSKGDLAVAVPHQDVLIFADVQNPMGYDILAQMTMKFFAEGRIPITSLAFMYEDKGLEPVFILAKNKPTE